MVDKFNFVGELFVPKRDGAPNMCRTAKTKSGDKYHSLSFGIKESDHNMAFVELFGMRTDTIKVFTTERERVEIDWEDRFDSDNVANAMMKYSITFDERKEFISAYDTIEYFMDNYEDYKDKKFRVSGRIRMNVYQGKVTPRYEIQYISVVDADTKSKLRTSIDVYYNKESLDTADWKKEKIVRLNGYQKAYIDKENGVKYVPSTFVFNCSKIDFDNEKQKAAVDFRMNEFLKLKQKGYVHMGWTCGVVNGTEEAEISYDDLTKMQKKCIDAGINTLDDFKEKTFGDRVQEMRLISPIVMGEFEDGVVGCDMSDSDFEDEIYHYHQPEEKEESEMFDDAVMDDDEENLFG